MGYSPPDLVAMQGPFSEEVNLALWRHFGVDVVVTKESGPAGGLGEKLSAASRLGIPVVMIKRPPEPPDAVGSVEEAVKQALEYLKQLNKSGVRTYENRNNTAQPRQPSARCHGNAERTGGTGEGRRLL